MIYAIICSSSADLPPAFASWIFAKLDSPPEFSISQPCCGAVDLLRDIPTRTVCKTMMFITACRSETSAGRIISGILYLCPSLHALGQFPTSGTHLAAAGDRVLAPCTKILVVPARLVRAVIYLIPSSPILFAQSYFFSVSATLSLAALQTHVLKFLFTAHYRRSARDAMAYAALCSLYRTMRSCCSKSLRVVIYIFGA